MDPTLGIQLQPGDSPLYQQIFDQIMGRIQNGALPHGTRLPPTRALARSLGTTRNTVVRAFDDLSTAGWLESVVGRGTFVRAPVAHPPAAPAAEGLPWSALFSRAATSEVLQRGERLTAGLSSRPCIDAQRLQPAAELLPAEPFRRCVDHVLRTRKGRALGYAPVQGIPCLREQLAAELGRGGIACRPEDIVVTGGSQQAIDLITRTLVNPGDKVLVDPHTYGGALGVFATADARVVAVPTDGEGPALDALDRHGDAKMLYVMPDAQNPTAQWISRERREALVAWSRRSGVPIVEDDYASDLDLDNTPMPPALRALDGDVLHVATASKKLIPSLRIGMVVCPPAFRRRLLQIKGAADLCGSALLQHALAEFLDRGYLRAHLAVLLPEYRRRRDALVGGLQQHLPETCTVRVARRGTSLWISLPAGVDPVSVFIAAQRRGVLITPGTLNTPTGTDSNGLRMTFCAEPPERLLQAAERVSDAIHSVLTDARTPPIPMEGP